MLDEKMMYINNFVKTIIKKYKTNNAFEISKLLNIIILYENLGKVKGYYNCLYRQKFIHINSNLNYQEQLFTCSHELGHALMHPKENTRLLRNETNYFVNKLEQEAQIFAINLYLNDDVFQELIEKEYSSAQISNFLNIDNSLIEKRFKQYLFETKHQNNISFNDK